jgi:AraC family ethanolamine operon transcriptional activator
LRAALQHIAGHRDGALDAASLASSCGVSRRTLEYAFRDSIGVSPSAYLKALALRELNADLFRARAKEHRISELASRRGFHHAGQLARDYFDMFGELPRDTLRR